jgi:hypothetical protein
MRIARPIVLWALTVALGGCIAGRVQIPLPPVGIGYEYRVGGMSGATGKKG